MPHSQPRLLAAPAFPLPLLALLLLFCLAIPLRAAPAMEPERVISPGGIEAWLIRDDSNPLLALEFAFRGGAGEEPDDLEGLTALATSLLTEGAGEYDSEAFQDELADRSIQLSFSGGQDRIGGSLLALTRQRDEAFRLLRLAMTEPRFDEPVVERLRQQFQVVQARRAQEPDTIAWRALYGLLFGDHPYARPSEGTPESLGRIGVEDLRAFVKGQFARDRLYIAAAGDIDADTLGRLLDETFGVLPEAGTPPRALAAEIDAEGGVVVIDRDQPQSTVVIGQRGVPRDHPDYITAALVNHIMGGSGFSSRLFVEVREKRGLAYSVYSTLASFDQAALLLAGVGSENARVAEAVGLMRAEWQRMGEEGPSEEELQAAKDYTLGAFALSLSSSSRIASTLLSMQLENLGIDYMVERRALIESVTPEEARRVAAEIFDPDAMTVVVVGRPAELVSTRPAPGAG